MDHFQNWVDQLPMAPLPSIAIFFLIASIGGWYVGDLDPLAAALSRLFLLTGAL